METPNKVTLAEPSDSKAIWSIRYHPTVNATAMNTEPVDFEQHDAWFMAQYFGGRAHRCFVLRVEDSVAGYCRFDKKGDYFEISIALAPEYQGRGLGQVLLRESMAQLLRPVHFRALIKKDNSGSRSLFERNSFVAVGEESGAIIFERDF